MNPILPKPHPLTAELSIIGDPRHAEPWRVNEKRKCWRCFNNRPALPWPKNRSDRQGWWGYCPECVATVTRQLKRNIKQWEDREIRRLAKKRGAETRKVWGSKRYMNRKYKRLGNNNPNQTGQNP